MSRSPARGVASRLLPALLLLAAGTACTGDGVDSGSGQEPAAEPTPITAFDTASAALTREDFCDRIPDEAVTAVVGEVASRGHYGNGERTPIADGVTDVAHEFNCTFTGDSGAVARAWIFVPRVTRTQAKALVADAKKAKGCRAVDGQTFGAPGTGSVCTTPDGTEATYRGLFTDAWFSCSVTAKDLDEPTLLEQAGQWCVSSATAAEADE
ncbi:MAG: hypothetical protein ABWX84_06415 [Nocardioides sp.]